jgi:hypothetical protein
MPTARDFNKWVYQCGAYEAQDVLREADYAFGSSFNADSYTMI